MSKRFIMLTVFFGVPVGAVLLAGNPSEYFRLLIACCVLSAICLAFLIQRVKDSDPDHRETPSIAYAAKGGSFIDSEVREPNRTRMLCALYGTWSGFAWILISPLLLGTVWELFRMLIRALQS